MIDAVLFDLDGTLIDTAPDMGGALNDLLIEENLQPIPLAQIRPYVSQGVLVLTRLGFGDRIGAFALATPFYELHRNTRKIGGLGRSGI